MTSFNLSFLHEKDAVHAVIAYKVDRVSRNIEDYSVIRGTLRRYGVEIKSVTEYFEDTSAGRFMENIIANVSQFDNEVRAERSVGGMYGAVAEEGRYVWRAPLGYDNVKINNKATIAPNRFAPLVKQAFELAASGLYSTNEVRMIMAQRGLVNSSGRPIARSGFYRILRNPLYKGVIQMFGEQHRGFFESTVSASLFNKAQTILDRKRNITKQYLNDNPDFPLRRFVRSLDGGAVSGYWAQGRLKKYPYYFFKDSKKAVRKEVLEEEFINLMADHRSDISIFNRFEKFLKEEADKYSKNKGIEQRARNVIHQ